ncbi:two-component regulator propeller domain-containing protein [Parabacteroides sp. PF5-6]|uniref:two-component regulator propeller domain-containing protein n=1 Tax=Parabacteroides sp. PF5-6 TaxID=1742403 RepID=UPI0024073E57|nr:two-component regulator propeller domain-containing protein [Parabacteroides sp. PF5-6]
MDECVNKKIRNSFLVFFLLCLCFGVEAVPFRFVHYDVSDGLSGNCVRSLAQDSRGFIWFGTDNGLNRFDGYAFKVFKTVAGDSTTLGSNYIYALYEDRQETLWIGTETGIYTYLPEKEEFLFFDKQTEEGVSIQSFITAISEDRRGHIWISTLRQGVFSYNIEKDVLRQYLQSTDDQRFSLTSDHICFLYVDAEDVVWAAPQQVGRKLNRLDINEERFYPYTLNGPADVLNELAVYGMAEDQSGHLWLGTWVGGICRLNKQTGAITPYLPPSSKGGAFHVHSLLMYDTDILLVGSDDGLHYFNTSTGEYTLMTATEFNDKSLSDKFIYPIHKDKEGGLWIGTYYGGVNYSPPPKGYIEGYAHSNYRNSVNGHIISRFCEDEKGNIWIGSDDGGLSYLDVETETFTNYMPEPGKNSLSYHNIHALFLEDDKLWIGTYSGSLNVFDLKTRRFSVYPSTSEANTLDNSSIYSIYKDSESRIWIGSMQGVMYYNRETDDFTRAKTTGTTTMDIVDDGHRAVWFATGGRGVFRYDQRTGEWTQYRHDANDTRTLPSNVVNCVQTDASGRLWIGTDNGFCYYDREEQLFTRVHLPPESASVSDIIADGDFLWLPTANGLIHFSTKDYTYRLFTQTDGLQGDQFTVKASLLARSGKMYLGTTNGFNVIDPQTISANAHIPPVHLTNLQIFNRDEPIGPNSLLPRSIEYMDEIRLSHKQNVFSIEYAALSFGSPEKNQYRYKLEGFDKEWNEVGNQRKATYTNLPAGQYLFRVVASNNDNVWNLQGATLQIRILPPFWKTVWAYLFYLLICLGIVGYLIYSQRKRAERKHRARMHQLNVEKEKELYNAKINFFTLIAHEIRTPVTLIIGPLEKVMENAKGLPADTQSDLKIIDRNSQRLLSLVNQLLDFRKAEQGAFIIRFSRQNMQELLQNVYDRFKPLIEQKGIIFRLQMPQEPLTATVDAEAITKVVSNLLTNAFKFGKKEITLRCTADNNRLQIQVTDDGRGIDAREAENIFRPFYQAAQNNVAGTGIGLSLVKLLVDAHHGTVRVDSQPEIATAFTVDLPLEQQEETIVPEKTTPQTATENLSLPADKMPQPHATRQSTLLIVEDNAEMRNFLCESFEWNFRILLAENGKEGLEQLKKHQVDIIISDVMMPVMDGITFSKTVKENIQYCHIPLILLTAKADTDSKVSGIQAGADAYIEKPFSPQVLRAQVENLLNSRNVLKKKFSEMPFVTLDSMAVNKADEKFLAKMNRIIEKNISNMDFSVDALAEQLYISRSGLFVKIKNLVGMTPNELIQLIRLKKAAELLLTKEYRINEICYQVGFNNPSYFSKCFQKQFGVLPKEFVSMGRKKED